MKKLALLFPGQGSQYIGMGKELWDSSKKTQMLFEEASEVLGFDLAKLCFEGEESELTKTENTQPALLTLSTAIWQEIQDRYHMTPMYLAGHSLGEYSALVCSGAMAFADAVQIVRKRGEFMQQAAGNSQGAMAAIMHENEKEIETVCKQVSSEEQIAVLANYNSTRQKVISGDKAAVEKAVEMFQNDGIVAKLLNVSGAFHSPLMLPAAEKLKNELMRYKYSPMKYQVISNVTATPYQSEKEIIKNLTAQLTSPVQWTKTIHYLDEKDITIAIEVGPKQVLKKLMRNNSKSITAYHTDDMKCIEALSEIQEIKKLSLKELDPDMTVITRSMAMAVTTKNNNFDEAEYKKGVVEPYKKLQRMQEELEEKNQKPTEVQMLEALNILKMIFETKGVSVKEQQERINEILEQTEMTNLLNSFEMPQ